MLCKRKWFLAAMFTGGALALAGCDDSGISQNTYNDAKKATADAKEEVNSLTSEKNDLMAKLKGTEADAKETYDRLTFDLAEAEKELEDAKEEVNSLTSEKNDLTAKLKGTEDDAKEEYDRVTSELAEAEKELEDAKEEVNSLTSEKNDLTAKLKGTEDDAKEEYDRVTSELAEAEKELEDAKEEVNSLTSEKNDLTAKLKGTEDDAKEEYDRVTSELAEAEKELKDAKEEVNSLTSEKNDLTAKLKGTEDDAKEEYDRVTSELAEAEKELKDAKEEVNSLTSEKNDLTAKLKGTEDDAKEEYDRVTSELAEAEKELKDAKEEVNSLTSEKNDLTAKLKGTEDDAKEEYDRVTSELAEAEKELKDAKEEVNSLTSEKNDLTAKLKGTEDDAKEEFDRVTSELAETEKELKDAKEEVNSLTSEKNNLTAAQMAAKTEYDRLTSELEEAKKELEAAKMVRFGSITADPGEVLDAIDTSKGEATVVTLKKTDDGKQKLEVLGEVLGEGLDEIKLRLPRIAGFVGTEFKRSRSNEDGGTTKIRAVAWSDVKTLSKLGDMPLSSSSGWDWTKVDPELKRDTGDGDSQQYVVEAATSVKGTYNDVQGVYTCEKEEGFCTSKGVGEEGVGVIKFTPKADYLSFGAWMIKTEGDAQSSPVVGVFAMGGPEFDFPNKSPSSAEYTGGATGFYAKREVGTGASAGSYTADITLNTDFEHEGIVSGKVTNFQDMRNGMGLGWGVKLAKIDITTGKKGGPFKGVTSGQVNFGGDDADLSGNWNVKFYGNGKQPGSVAGMFNARTGDPGIDDIHYLDIVGAFGAKMKVQPSAQ